MKTIKTKLEPMKNTKIIIIATTQNELYRSAYESLKKISIRKFKSDIKLLKPKPNEIPLFVFDGLNWNIEFVPLVVDITINKFYIDGENENKLECPMFPFYYTHKGMIAELFKLFN